MRRVDGSGWMRGVAVPAAGLLCCLPMSGCLVAGYSSRGGGFLWPSGLGLLLMILLFFFLMRGRR